MPAGGVGARGLGSPPAEDQQAGDEPATSHLKDAHKTLSFWMIWGVLFLNVSAGIAVLSMASPMLQDDLRGPTLIGQARRRFRAALEPADQLKAVAAVATGGFVGLLSLFNIGGRFFWASLSDRIGRKATYLYVLRAPASCSTPRRRRWRDHGIEGAVRRPRFCIILSMYGGGFATVPAYLADIFGTKFVGAIHGRLLTAWSAAGVVGSEVIVGVRDHEIAAGVAKTQVYDAVMYVMVGVLALGFICNLLVRPVDPKWHMNASAPADGATAPWRRAPPARASARAASRARPWCRG